MIFWNCIKTFVCLAFILLLLNFYGWFIKFLGPCVSLLAFLTAIPSFDTMNHSNSWLFFFELWCKFSCINTCLIHRLIWNWMILKMLIICIITVCSSSNKTYWMYQLKTSDQSLNHWKNDLEASNCVKNPPKKTTNIYRRAKDEKKKSIHMKCTHPRLS